jgi:autotransporter-associated beta strand protein
MKRMFTKILGMCAGLFLCAGVQAMDAYTPDLIWSGAKDSLFNDVSLNWITPTDSLTALAFSTGKKLLVSNGRATRRLLLMDRNLEAGGLVFDSPSTYTFSTTTTADGIGNTLSGDFQMVQRGAGVVTMTGKGFTIANTKGTLIENNATLRVNGPGGAANAGNLIAETAFGPKVSFNNGSLMMGSSSNTTATLLGYEKMKWDINVADNSYGTFTFDRYCTWEGKMSGAANTAFNLYLRCIREVFGGDASNFKGTFTAAVDHSSDAGTLTTFTPVTGGPACVAFILADTSGVAEFNADGSLHNVLRREDYLTQRDTLLYTYATRYPMGMPDATINIKDSVIMVWGSDLSTRSGEITISRDNSICRLGALNGTALSILGSTKQGSSTTNHSWQIGSNNTNSVFNGQIMNSGFKSKSGLTNNIIKVGTGDWRLTNASHSYNGKTWVRQGSMTILGRITSNGKLVVDSGAVLKGTPNFTALSSSDIDGTLELGGEASNHGIGTMTFGAGDINVNANAKIRIGLGQGNRCDAIKYAGLTTFDGGATIEFFVEEGPVAAGDTFAVLIPISTAATASVANSCNVVMQDGLVLDVTHLFDDPIWAGKSKYLCGVVKVISNTNPGVYTAQAAAVTSVSPVAKSAVGVSGSIKVTYDKNIARGTGAITMGGVAFEPVISANVATINYTGLAAEPDSFDLVIPAGAIKESSNNAATAAYTVRYYHDKIAPTLVSQSVRADSIMTWEDGNITFTFSKGVVVANAAAITINQTQFEKVKTSVNNAVLTVSTVALNYGKNYTITIPAGAITDAVGNPGPAVSLNFSTANPLTYDDVTAFNTRPNTNLPITFDTLTTGSSNTYPFWSYVNSGAGTYANGEITWTSNSTNNKIMTAFVGKATKINVYARRTGTDAVGLKIQEAVAESSVSKWRTIRELSSDELTLTKQLFSYTPSANIRFFKILPSTASATASVIISGYSIEGIPASVKQVAGSSISYCNVANGLSLEGLTMGSRIDVYDLTGVRKASIKVNASSMTVPVQGFSIVKITSDAGTTVIKAMVR